MTRPLVSVVLIFRNELPFLEEAIESVFAQSYDSWELLLVDDGSDDGSSAIATRYAAAHPDRVRYLEHPGHANRGTSASRNVGIRHARGVSVAFLDGDDVWLPPKLEEQVATLEANPDVALVYGATQYWYSWTGDPADAGRDFVRPLGVEPNSVVAPPRLLTLALESRAPVAWPSDFMVRRSVLEQIGGFEEQFTGLFDDQALLAKLYLRETVFVSDCSWFRYRRHDRSFTSTARDTKHILGLDYFRWLEGYLVQTGTNDEDVWRALREKRARYAKETARRTERGLKAGVQAFRALGGRTRRFVTGLSEE